MKKVEIAIAGVGNCSVFVDSNRFCALSIAVWGLTEISEAKP